MIVEAALSDGHGAARKLGANTDQITIRVEVGGIVWMNAGGEVAEAGIALGETAGTARRLQRLTDADKGNRARLARTFDNVGTIGVERRIGEVDVAVDECHESTNRRARRRFDTTLANRAGFTALQPWRGRLDEKAWWPDCA